MQTLAGGGDRMKAVNPLHAGAWALWLLAVIAALAGTRNPIYLGLLLAWIAVVWWTAKSVAGIMNSERAVPLSPLRFGVFVVSVSAVFNASMIQSGDHVLFSLPDGLPLIGGPFTLEAMVYGALNGLVLTGLYAAFLLVNRVLPVRDMVRLVPRAYHSVAIVVSIAVTFVPTTLRQFQQIREAQAVRGHRVHGLRGWLPLLIPLLTGGMERALQLAEAMMSRGYSSTGSRGYGGMGARGAASTERSAGGVWTQAGLAAGLALFTGGLLVRLAWGYGVAGGLLAGVGAVLVVASGVARREKCAAYRLPTRAMAQRGLAGGRRRVGDGEECSCCRCRGWTGVRCSTIRTRVWRYRNSRCGSA